MDKKIYLAAIAGIATLIVFGGCGQEADDTSLLFPTPTEIEQDAGEDFDFEFDPSVELSVTPSVDWQTTPTLTEEEPDEDGNLPDEGDLELMMTPIPEPTATPEPTPTKEVVPTPTEAPTATPEPSATPEPEEEGATVAPTPTAKPTKVPTEAVKAAATAAPTKAAEPTKKAEPTKAAEPTKKAEPTKAASKEPTMEKDGYAFKDPTGLKVGATVGTLTSGMGKEVTIVHHEVGDLIEAWNDGLENNCTYLYHKDSHSCELISYGKYQPKSSDKNPYFYIDNEGYIYDYVGGKCGKEATDVAVNMCDAPREQISFTTEGTESGTSSGTWQ